MTEPEKCEGPQVGKRQNVKLAGVGCTGVGQVIVGGEGGVGVEKVGCR